MQLQTFDNAEGKNILKITRVFFQGANVVGFASVSQESIGICLNSVKRLHEMLEKANR